jgi:hypothetical protein
VRSDLAAIPVEKTDQNYVDTWLQGQMVEYERVAGRGTLGKMYEAMEQSLKRLGLAPATEN